MEIEEIKEVFGFDPNGIGNRPRGYWIVREVEGEEETAGAKEGDLCVKTRDGASNPICMSALQIPNCIGTAEDDFDCTYRYYYYRPLTTP